MLHTLSTTSRHNTVMQQNLRPGVPYIIQNNNVLESNNIKALGIYKSCISGKFSDNKIVCFHYYYYFNLVVLCIIY